MHWMGKQVNQDSIVTHKKGVNNSLELQDLSNNSELLICYFFMNGYSLITKENSWKSKRDFLINYGKFSEHSSLQVYIPHYNSNVFLLLI